MTPTYPLPVKFPLADKRTLKGVNGDRLGYVCNPRSLKEGTETSRRMTDELGSRQRDLSTIHMPQEPLKEFQWNCRSA